MLVVHLLIPLLIQFTFFKYSQSTKLGPRPTDTHRQCAMIKCVPCSPYQTYALTTDGCQTCTCVDTHPCKNMKCEPGAVCRQIQCAGCDTLTPLCVADPCKQWEDSCPDLECSKSQRRATTPYGCPLCWCVEDRATGVGTSHDGTQLHTLLTLGFILWIIG